MVALGELLALLVDIFTTTQLWIDNSENKILIWWPQLPKELTGGDGYKYRFKPNAVQWIFFPHKESKRLSNRLRSKLRNSSSGCDIYILKPRSHYKRQSDMIPLISMESWRFLATRDSDRWRPDGVCSATWQSLESFNFMQIKSDFRQPIGKMVELTWSFSSQS